MPLTRQIGGDEVGGEKFPVATHLCNTAADSVGVVDDVGDSAPAEGILGRVAPQARGRRGSIRRPQNSDASQSQATAVEPAPNGRPRTRTSAGPGMGSGTTVAGMRRASTSRAISLFKPARCRSTQSAGIDSSSADVLD
jgi:hypothetical protein